MASERIVSESHGRVVSVGKAETDIGLSCLSGAGRAVIRAKGYQAIVEFHGAQFEVTISHEYRDRLADIVERARVRLIIELPEGE